MENIDDDGIEQKRALAYMVVDLVDHLPPPRHIERSEEMQSLGENLSLLAVDVPGFALRALAGNLSKDEVADAAIQALRLHGERVGPFRKRKIRKLISFY